MKRNKCKCISAQVRKCRSAGVQECISSLRQQQKKIFLLSILLLFLVVFSAGCAKQEIKNIDSKGVNIVCLGDSLTYGYGVDKGADYPSVLAGMINVPVINAGVDGNTSIEGLKRFNSDVLEKNPILVIIEFGGNDFLKQVPMKLTVSNITEMIEKAQSKGAMVALIDISAGMLFAEYRVQLIKLAKQKGAILIPSILEGIVTNPSLKSDFLHPNNKGYILVAQRVYRSIAPYFQKHRQ